MRGKDCVIDVKSNKNADKRQTMYAIKKSNHQRPGKYAQIFCGSIHNELPVQCTLIVFNTKVFQFTCASFGQRGRIFSFSELSTILPLAYPTFFCSGSLLLHVFVKLCFSAS